MNIKILVPTLLTLGLVACGGGDPPADARTGWAGIAEKARDGIREEMATENFDIGRGVDGLPHAELSPEGDLLIGGKAVSLTPAQRERLLDYRGHLAGVAQAGADVGIQGAAIAATAMKEAAKAALGGDQALMEQRIQAQADTIKASAHDLCNRLPGLLESQRAAAEAIPELVPYANMDETDINDCTAETEVAAP